MTKAMTSPPDRRRGGHTPRCRLRVVRRHAPRARGRAAPRLRRRGRRASPKAVRHKPDDLTARLSLDRAKLRASQRAFHHRSQARSARETRRRSRRVRAGRGNEPQQRRHRPGTADHAESAPGAPSPCPREGKTGAADARSSARAICRRLGSTCPQGVKMPAALTFRDASSRDVFTAIARLANISIIFDSAFRETPVSVDLRDGDARAMRSTPWPARRARSSACRRRKRSW